MTEIRPELSIQVVTFAAEDPGNWNAMVDRAVAADTAGIDRLVVSDHVAFGENLDAYADPTLGGTEGGRQPTGPDGHWLEPLTVLTYLAARTRRIRLGTSILQAALRRPAVLAKAAATLDVLSTDWERGEFIGTPGLGTLPTWPFRLFILVGLTVAALEFVSRAINSARAAAGLTEVTR